MIEMKNWGNCPSNHILYLTSNDRIYDDHFGLFGFCCEEDMHSIRSSQVKFRKPLGKEPTNTWQAFFGIHKL